MLSGLLISFLGSLPFGTLNTTAFQIAALQGINNALFFALAVVLIELIVVRITLIHANKIDFQSKLFYYVLPITIVLLIYLSVSSFMSSVSHQEMETNTYLFPMIKSSFLLGLLLSTLNPMHIPFWMGWNSILLERKTLDKSPGIYSSYIIGIGLGSIAALMIFIFTGKFIYQNYQQYNHVIAFIMGCLYLGFSFYIIVLFYKKHLKLNIV
jgi:threonine/homoserine/homoserine lactone efflux protein